MPSQNEARRAKDWQILHDRITNALAEFGARKDAVRKGDYWLVDEDWGSYFLKLEVQKLDLLQPPVIKALQDLLKGYPDWEITFRVDVLDKENEWPAMGLVIYHDEIIDDLRREFLPEQFRNITYPGSKRWQRP